MTGKVAPDELERCVKGAYKYDFEQVTRILRAMLGLRNEAARARIPEVITMVDSSFEVLRTTHDCILRHEKLPAVPPLDREPGPPGHDKGQAERILEALNDLRREAEKARLTDIITMIDASFRLILTSYYCVLRLEMTSLPATDDIDLH